LSTFRRHWFKNRCGSYRYRGGREGRREAKRRDWTFVILFGILRTTRYKLQRRFISTYSRISFTLLDEGMETVDRGMIALD